jgi:hypothetical protein
MRRAAAIAPRKNWQPSPLKTNKASGKEHAKQQTQMILQLVVIRPHATLYSNVAIVVRRILRRHMCAANQGAREYN